MAKSVEMVLPEKPVLTLVSSRQASFRAFQGL